MDNLLVSATERKVYGWVDPRALYAPITPDYWRTIWMAVSCCCGLRGEAEPAPLPSPQPRLPSQSASEIADVLVATGMG